MFIVSFIFIALTFILAGFVISKFFQNELSSLTAYYFLGLNTVVSLIILGVPLYLLFYGNLLFLPAAIYYILKKYKALPFHLPDGRILGPAFLISFPFFLYIFLEPLSAWDARSIWFFHGKMIFWGGGLYKDAGFMGPQFPWYHFDYPKLVAGFSGLAAYYTGYWNEYIPKISLALLLLGVIFAISELSYPKSIGKILILVLLLMFRPVYIYNGYADGWLAIYVFISHLSFINYFKYRHSKDLEIALMSCLLLPQLKNEGILLALLSLGNSFIICRFFMERRGLNDLRDMIKSNKSILIIAIFPAIAWLILRSVWGLRNDLAVFSVDSLHRIGGRLFSEATHLIYSFFIRQQHLHLFLMATVVALSLSLFFMIKFKYNRDTISRYLATALLPFMTAIEYTLGLFTVYLLTPHSLIWHLKLSADRIVLPIILLFVVTLYPLVTRDKEGDVVA